MGIAMEEIKKLSEANPGQKLLKAPEERQTGKDNPFAYTITDKNFPDFKVLNSANAWWIDKVKVMNLVSAYKMDCTDEEASVYAGITPQNLRYFKELHPEFLQIKQACKQLPMLKARKKIVESLETDVENAHWYAERKRKGEFSKRDENVIIPSEKTLEDLIDDYENEDSTGKQNIDREVDKNQDKEGGDSTIQAECSPKLLLAAQDSPQPAPQSPAEGSK